MRGLLCKVIMTCYVWLRFHEAKKKYEEIQSMVSQMKTFSRELQQILEEREGKYFNFRKEISKRINYFFIMNLSQRGYTGKLEVGQIFTLQQS